MTATKAFKKTAGKKGAAAFNYEREVARAWRDMPKVKDKVFFMDVCAKKLVYPDVHDADNAKKRKISLWLKNNPRFKIAAYFSVLAESNLFCPLRNGRSVVLLYLDQGISSYTTREMSPAQRWVFALNHELAHAIIPDASYGDGKKIRDVNVAECIADAYATIRHLQRYGAGSSVIDKLTITRLKGELTHFTTPVIQQILARRRDIDWKSLTPRETMRVARQFALKYSMSAMLRKSDTYSHAEKERFRQKFAQACGLMLPLRKRPAKRKVLGLEKA